MVVHVQHGPPLLRALVLQGMLRSCRRGARVRVTVRPAAKKPVEVLVSETEMQNSAVEEQAVSC